MWKTGFKNINEDLGWAWPFWAVVVSISLVFVLTGIGLAFSHPPEDCFKRTHPATVAKIATVQKKPKSDLEGFQKRQDLPITGKWDTETLDSCKNVCLKLGNMEK